MEKDSVLGRKFKDAGAADDLILQYYRYLDSGNRQGQERLLWRFRQLQSERLQKDREKLSCLDYIIARVENSRGLFEGGSSSGKIN